MRSTDDRGDLLSVSKYLHGKIAQIGCVGSSRPVLILMKYDVMNVLLMIRVDVVHVRTKDAGQLNCGDPLIHLGLFEVSET